MPEFTRTNNEELFVDSGKAMPIFIRYTPENEEYHNRANDFKFKDFIAQISGVKNSHIINKGKNKKGNVQIAFLIDNSDYCVIVSPSSDGRSFYNPHFFDEKYVVPTDKNECSGMECNIRFIGQNDDILVLLSEINWLTRFSEIAEFVSSCYKLQIPLKEIRKEEDKAVWHAYIDGLTAINNSKKDLCRILKINQPQKKRDKRGSSITTIDIQIDTTNVDEILRQGIEDLFEGKYDSFPKIDFVGQQCIISFDVYQIIHDDIIEKIKSIAYESCYVAKDAQTTNYMQGNLLLLSDENELAKISNEVKDELHSFGAVFQEINKNEFSFDEDEEIEFLNKIVSTNWNDLASVKSTTKITTHLTALVDENALKNSTDIPILKIERLGDFVVLKTKDPLDLNSDHFQNYTFDSCRIKITPKAFNDAIEINELEKKDNSYFGTINDIKKISHANTILHSVINAYDNKGGFITKEYFYSLRPSINKSRLAKIRLAFYGDKNIRVDVARAIVDFFPASKEDYLSLRSRFVAALNDDIQIDDPIYKPSAKLVFLSEDVQFRKETFSEIDNALSDIKQYFTKFSIDNNEYRKLEFNFNFREADERERIKVRIDSVSKQFSKLAFLKYESDLGSTAFVLQEDQKLREDLEKSLHREFSKEQVNLINGTNYDSLEDSIEIDISEDDPYYESKFNWQLRKTQREFLRNTETIGSCISRTPEKVTILLSDDYAIDLTSGTLKINKGDYIQFPVIGKSLELYRQKTAMDRIMNPGRKLGKTTIPAPANERLPNFLFDPRYAEDTVVDINIEKEKIKKNRIEPLLNDRQLEAVTKAVLAKDLALIQGPPGTGKTTVIAEIIWQEILRNPDCKILLTSQTNLAVDNALERLQGKRGIRPVRIVSKGATDKLEREGLRYLVSVIDDWSNKSKERNIDNAANLWVDAIVEGVSKENKYLEVVGAWKKDLSTKDDFIRQKFADAYKQNVNLVAATCSICGSKDFTDTFKGLYNENELAFDIVIMDEASKATPLEMAIPLVWGRKIIVIGDHKQLPPTMDEDSLNTALRKIGREDLAEKIENIRESQFKKLFVSAAKVRSSIVATLDTQYRMHEKIMNTINQFYADELAVTGGLKCGILETMDIQDFTNRGSRYHGLDLIPFLSPQTHAIWVDVQTPETNLNPGYKNEGELEAIELVLNALQKANGFNEYINAQKKPEDKEIGIITFYSGQKNEIRNRHKLKKLGNFCEFRIDVVDRFQGMERNVVIVSTVRSNHSGNIGFAKEIERINVAFSRAKRLLIVIGNKQLFERNDAYKRSISKMETIYIKQLKDILR